MKHITTAVLLCVLAVMTLSIATSCKAQGPRLPSQPGLYIDAGYGYKSYKEAGFTPPSFWLGLPPTIAAGTLMKYSTIFDENEIRTYTRLVFKGNVIRIATRSMGWSYQEAEQISLYPLSYQLAYPEEYADAGYVCFEADFRQGATINESRPEKSYTYVELRNIPESPTGYYLLGIDRGYVEFPMTILLQRP